MSHMTVQEYIEWHRERYGVKPTEKLINSFCEINKIQRYDKSICRSCGREFENTEYKFCPWCGRER